MQQMSKGGSVSSLVLSCDYFRPSPAGAPRTSRSIGFILTRAPLHTLDRTVHLSSRLRQVVTGHGQGLRA